MVKIKDTDLIGKIDEIIRTKIDAVRSENMVPYYLVLNSRAYLALCIILHKTQLRIIDLAEYRGLPIVRIADYVEDVQVIRRPFEELAQPLESDSD